MITILINKYASSYNEKRGPPFIDLQITIN